jgi:hypothetical protein
MRDLEAVYVDDVEVKHPGGDTIKLNVWMNPETKQLFAVENMEIPTNRNSVIDPYQEDVRLHFADTFTGLPK